MKELLLATQNQGKLKEIQAIFSGTGYNILTPHDVGIGPEFDVEETGKTFAENSEIKAVAFAQAAMMLTLADDSGLSVKALDGFPGVKSKRFIEGTDQDRNAKILELMENQEDREAEFVTDLCLYDPVEQKTVHFEGRVKGTLTRAPQGDHNVGFGYDPIFIPEGYDKTFAELGQETKNELSHRAKALAKAKEYLSKP